MKQNVINKIEKLAREKQVKNVKRGRKSKFDLVYNSVVLMRRRRFSWKQIHETLNEGGLKCSYLGLMSWKSKRKVGGIKAKKA